MSLLKIFNKIVEKLYFAQDGNLALYDKLTGIYNYNWYTIVGIKKYDDKEIFITVVDVNNFKNINDTKGHIYGNKILQNISHQLHKLKEFDETAEVVRFGGDEFLIFSKTNLSSLIKLYNDNDNLVSFGTVKKYKNEHLSVAISRADQRMYNNKKYYKKKYTRKA